MIELRSALAERESALLNARGYATELQQMYRNTLSACEDAEARVQALEGQLLSVKPDPPLLVISPPASSAAPAPFLALTEPVTRMSAKDKAVVARLLTAIERLCGERDTLKRDLHFANVEHRMADEALRARLDATQREVSRLQESVDQRSSEGPDVLRSLQEELEAWREKCERADAELTDRTIELTDSNGEMSLMRSHLQEIETSRAQLIASYKDLSRLAVSSLIAIQHFQSKLDEKEERLAEIRRTSDEAAVTQQTLRADLAASNAQFANATKEIQGN
jgi:chromosome segregation ATPase